MLRGAVSRGFQNKTPAWEGVRGLENLHSLRFRSSKLNLRFGARFPRSFCVRTGFNFAGFGGQGHEEKVPPCSLW